MATDTRPADDPLPGQRTFDDLAAELETEVTCPCGISPVPHCHCGDWPGPHRHGQVPA